MFCLLAKGERSRSVVVLCSTTAQVSARLEPPEASLPWGPPRQDPPRADLRLTERGLHESGLAGDAAEVLQKQSIPQTAEFLRVEEVQGTSAGPARDCSSPRRPRMRSGFARTARPRWAGRLRRSVPRIPIRSPHRGNRSRRSASPRTPRPRPGRQAPRGAHARPPVGGPPRMCMARRSGCRPAPDR